MSECAPGWTPLPPCPCPLFSFHLPAPALPCSDQAPRPSYAYRPQIVTLPAADITIGALPNGPERAKEFGLMKIDENRRVMVGVGKCGKVWQKERRVRLQRGAFGGVGHVGCLTTPLCTTAAASSVRSASCD